MDPHYPCLNECWDHMIADQGLSVGSVPFNPGFLVGISYSVDDLDRVEQALSKLSPDDRETLAIGDAEERPVVFQKIDTVGTSTLTNQLLDFMFEALGGHGG